MRQSGKAASLLVYVVTALLIGLVVWGLISIISDKRQANANANEIAASINRLQQIETGDPDSVVTVIRQQQKARMEAEREQMREALLSGEVDVWSQFQEYVILGDSRASGFSYYGWLPGEYVLAEPGDTIWKIGDYKSTVVAMAPARVFIAYGANDLDYWSEPSGFTDELSGLIEDLKTELPDLEVYVSSILLVQDWALTSSLRKIPEYNEAVRQMCDEFGYTYVDNDSLTAEHQELYEGDGIHFKASFYPHWAANFILAMYYSGAEEALSE